MTYHTNTLRLLASLVIHVGLFLSLLLTGCNADPQGAQVEFQKVSTQEFQIVDSKGQQRAWIGLEDDQPSLILYDKAGRIRVGIGLDMTGAPHLGLANVAGVPVINIALDEDGNMGFLVLSEEGVPRVAFGVGEDGRAKADLYSPMGHPTWSAP
jgi:hypothetical protein